MYQRAGGATLKKRGTFCPQNWRKNGVRVNACNHGHAERRSRFALIDCSWCVRMMLQGLTNSKGFWMVCTDCLHEIEFRPINICEHICSRVAHWYGPAKNVEFLNYSFGAKRESPCGGPEKNINAFELCFWRQEMFRSSWQEGTCTGRKGTCTETRRLNQHAKHSILIILRKTEHDMLASILAA